MTRSMTGYGRGESVLEDKTISVEIRSVNHRFFEFSCRMPRAYVFLEDKIKSAVAARVDRGKVDVFINVNESCSRNSVISVDEARAEGYYNALKEIAQRFDLPFDVTSSLLARFPDVLKVTDLPEDEGKLWSEISRALEAALDGFVTMRETEGAKLKRDVSDRAAAILADVDNIERLAPQTVTEYRERLSARMNEILGDAGIEPQRILTEAALFADKTAVDEETVRLRSHISQLCELLESDGAVGRKLDFIVQEMNREANTIGSKCQNIEITKTVVDIKSEIEKIREQVQNIE